MTRTKATWITALAVSLCAASPLALWAQNVVSPQPVLLENAADTQTNEAASSAPTPSSMDHGDALVPLEGSHKAEVAPLCDAEKEAALKKAAANAYKPMFFDNDFNYLCDPCYDGCLLGEDLKRLCFGNHGVLDIGGEYRLRFHNEAHMKPYLDNVNDNFLLQRLRVYANYEVTENLRVYGEILHAYSQYETAPPRPIDENYWEIQDFFIDGKLWETGQGTWFARFGRQELLYGSQRLVSPLDWANIRRRFDGGKVFYRSDAWDVDLFLTRPIKKALYQWDSTNQDQTFYGLFSTYKQSEWGKIDLYWLGYENNASPFRYQTAGSRLIGEQGALLYEFEGGYQFGEFQQANHNAGFFTIGLGHQFENAIWKPKFMAYYDWASGDAITGDGFDQLFPLGHAYLGWMDLFARRNIEDVNFQFTLKPNDPWTLMVWYHIFHRQDSNDVPYTVTNMPYPGTTPAGSRYLGQEIDFLAKCQLTPHSDIIFGYSHFFTGTYFQEQHALNPAVTEDDANFFYTQFTMRF